MVRSYRKGYMAENKLQHILYDRGYAVIRAPRSGRIDIASPDLIAIKNGKIVIIECKSRKDAFTVPPEQIEELDEWVSRTSGFAYVAWKIAYKGWLFLRLEDVKGNKGNVGKKFAEEKGIGIDDI